MQGNKRSKIRWSNKVEKKSYNGSRIPQQDLFLRFQGFITSHQFCVRFIGFQ